MPNHNREQELSNKLRAGAYREALVLALQLAQPFRLLNVFETLLEQDSGNTCRCAFVLRFPPFVVFLCECRQCQNRAGSCVADADRGAVAGVCWTCVRLEHHSPAQPDGTACAAPDSQHLATGNVHPAACKLSDAAAVHAGVLGAPLPARGPCTAADVRGGLCADATEEHCTVVSETQSFCMWLCCAETNPELFGCVLPTVDDDTVEKNRLRFLHTYTHC